MFNHTTPFTRRRWLLASSLVPLLGQANANANAAGTAKDTAALIRQGGVVVAFRHALAPGTFDPPQFKLGDCTTQRNLSAEGREQARRIGQWFTAEGLKPESVASSPWCRCMDTANLAFGTANSGSGTAKAWPALASPVGSPETTSAINLQQLRDALRQAGQQPGKFRVWVTHMFVLADLAGANTASGEALVLQADANGQPVVRARLLV